MASSNFLNWVKIISVGTDAVQKVDSTSEIYSQFNTKNALIFDNEAKVLYFIDSEANEGRAQRIVANTECPLYIVKGDGTTLEYTGESAITIDSDSIHKEQALDTDSLKPVYEDDILRCPCFTVDKTGHITNSRYVDLQLAGSDDSSLVTVAQTAVLFAQYATDFQVEACGMGSNVKYVLPDTKITGKSYKCIDAHEYYYSDGTTLIQYTDDNGNLKNPGAGDIIICSQVSPSIKWSVIVNKYETYTAVNTGIVPAYGEASTGILFASGWGYLKGLKGIKITDNRTIEHDNSINAGTAGQQHDHEGNPTDDLYIPHSVTEAADNPNFTITVPKITYDSEGHITGVVDSSVTIEVSKIAKGDFPSLTMTYTDSYLKSKSYTYDPNGSDKSISLEDIRAKTAADSSKLGGKSSTAKVDDIVNKSVTTVPTSSAVYNFVESYVDSAIDSSLSTESENAVQNKVVYDEIIKRDNAVYVKINSEHESVDASLNLKSDKSNVIEKNNTTEYTPTADYHPTTKKYVDEGDASLWEHKQNKLISGPGVTIVNSDITGESTIQFSSDLFIIIDGSVTKTEADTYIDEISKRVTPEDNKVYLWRLYDPSGGDTTTPTYIEFSYDSNSNPQTWVEIGRFRLDFLIDNRLKDIDASIQKIKESHVFMTEAEYEALTDKDPDKIYFTYEE